MNQGMIKVPTLEEQSISLRLQIHSICLPVQVNWTRPKILLQDTGECDHCLWIQLIHVHTDASMSLTLGSFCIKPGVEKALKTYRKNSYGSTKHCMIQLTIQKQVSVKSSLDGCLLKYPWTWSSVVACSLFTSKYRNSWKCCVPTVLKPWLLDHSKLF